MKFLLLFTVVLLEVFTGYAEEPQIPLQVACNLPMSRELAIYGYSVREGVEFFQETLSAEKKNSVVWNWQDNEGSGRNTVSIARMQLQSNPDIYVSGIKPQYMAIEDVLIKKKIPNFAWIFDPRLRAKKSDNFRTWVSFKDEAHLFLEWMRKEQPKKISIIYVQLPTVEEQQQEIIIPGLKELGFNDIQVISYQMDLLDFKTIALKVKQNKPDLIFLSGFQHNFIPMIKTFRAYNLIRENNAVSTYDLLDAVSDLDPRELEGIRVVAPEFLLSKAPEKDDWKKRFKAHFGKDPIYTHAYAYDMAKIIYEVAGQRQSKPDKTVKELLDTVDLEGISGDLKFNEHGDIGFSIDYGVFRNGKLERYLDQP
jgi:ABC-type branched-subunit amino acid transport system substrate-binding protein